MSTPILETPEYPPEFLTIPQKPQSPISYTFYPAIPPTPTPATHHLIIFVNGLGLPASSWMLSINLLRTTHPSCPAILTYDRFGQGLTTARDPLDGIPGKEHGHDFLDVAHDLHSIILTISPSKLGLSHQDISAGKLDVLLVGASIGAPISRLYVQHHPGIVAAMILLDSNIANVNYSDFLPDPDAPDFDPTGLLDEECSVKMYREARAKLVAMFDLKVKNAEGLDRTTSPMLLPDAGKPLLKGVGREGLELLVVGHDPETFMEMSLQMMGTPRCLSRVTNRYWAEYNEGLRGITDVGKCGEVVIAEGCGHFIQKDNPPFVAKAVARMLERLKW